MQVYEKLIIVTSNDLDNLNHVNNVTYVQWVQDIAEEHWLKNATFSILKNYYWVLTSHHIQYKNGALIGDLLLLRTYISKNEGVRSTRQVEIINNETKKLVVTSETVWCLIDASSKRPSRLTKEIEDLFN